MSDRPTAAGSESNPVLDRQLRDARMRAFHGRVPELSVLRTALTDRAGMFTVAHVHGPGGIGKSAFLHRFAEEAGRTVVVIHPGSADIGRWQAASAGDTPVVLIDDLDRAGHPVQWLRHAVLPAFPAGTLFAVASRRPPPVEWCAELGWSDMLLPIPLTPIPVEESAQMLRALGVPGTRRDSVARICGGNPLALRVAAAIVTDSDQVTDEDLRRELALSVSARLIGEYPSAAHRQALEVCAHAATTNENLIRAALPGTGTDALFTWLRDLPFVTSGPRGLHPSDVVRTVVEAELRWRDPDRFTAMNDRVTSHLLTRARTATGDAVLPAVADVVFVQRPERMPRPGLADLGVLDVREHPYRPSDRDEVIGLAGRALGADSARIAAFWLDRQPEGFHVFRDRREARMVAFVGQLDLLRPTTEELRVDPVVAAAWNRVRSSAALRSGQTVNIVRFLVDTGSGPRPSDVTTLILSRVATPLIRDDRIAWSVVASPDPGYWPVRITRTHTRDETPPVVVDGRAYTLFTAHPATGGDTGRTDGPAGDREEFDQEVRRALRAWRRPDLFAESALLRSRLAAEAGPDDAVTALRQMFTAALDTLSRDPRQAKYHRVLVTTFLNGAPTQEAAAERLNLPFSTYRRHLVRGLDDLCTLLWKAETDGLRLTPHRGL